MSSSTSGSSKMVVRIGVTVLSMKLAGEAVCGCGSCPGLFTYVWTVTFKMLVLALALLLCVRVKFNGIIRGTTETEEIAGRLKPR